MAEDDNDIVLDDEEVSRYHGVFYYKNNKAYFHDLGSTNETLINGKEINKLKRIKSGDKILLGRTKLEFENLS